MAISFNILIRSMFLPTLFLPPSHQYISILTTFWLVSSYIHCNHLTWSVCFTAYHQGRREPIVPAHALILNLYPPWSKKVTKNILCLCLFKYPYLYKITNKRKEKKKNIFRYPPTHTHTHTMNHDRKQREKNGNRFSSQFP